MQNKPNLRRACDPNTPLFQYSSPRAEAQGQSCETKPICAGPGKDQGHCGVKEEEAGRGRPTYEETACGLGGGPGLSRETKPIPPEQGLRRGNSVAPRGCARSSTGILPVCLTGTHARESRARMALRLMGRMPMLRCIQFPHALSAGSVDGRCRARGCQIGISPSLAREHKCFSGIGLRASPVRHGFCIYEDRRTLWRNISGKNKDLP